MPNPSTIQIGQQPARADLPWRQVLAVAMGNALEFYDFLTFSFFAIQIGHAFFPARQMAHGLLYSLATFGVGFITRPLGGVVIGSYGDRAGRRAAMMLSFALMGVAILGLALTPSYARIGIGAPILLLAFRLVQGFALGGEVGPSTAFLLEVAPPHRRGLYVSFQSASQGLAILAAGIVGYVLSSAVSPVALDAWGWRVAFLIGAAVIPVGLYLRRRLPETLHRPDGGPVSAVAVRVPARFVALSLMVLAAMTIATYVRGYMTTYAQDSLKLAAGIAFGATIINGLCGVLVCPLSGLISDRIGRKPVTLFAVGLLVAVGGAGLHRDESDADGAGRLRRHGRHERPGLGRHGASLDGHRRVTTPGGALRCPGHAVCRGHRGVRWVNPVHHPVADRCDPQSAGPCLVCDRGAGHRRGSHARHARVRALRAAFAGRRLTCGALMTPWPKEAIELLPDLVTLRRAIHAEPSSD